MTIELRLSLPLDWNGIETVRQGVRHCVEAAFGDEAFKDSVAMVTAELLENAVKYGTPGVDVQLALEERAAGFAIVVTNGVLSSSPHAVAIRERINWIKSFSDPREAYTTALIRAYEAQTDGGLGLVRIVYEGRCSVACDSLRTDEITVVAQCDSPRRRSPAERPMS